MSKRIHIGLTKDDMYRIEICGAGGIEDLVYLHPEVYNAIIKEFLREKLDGMIPSPITKATILRWVKQLEDEKQDE
jgi:hypothetical protein